MKTKNPSHSNKGFTLIEMLVTITIIVILAGLSLGGFNFVTTKQANSQAEIQINLLSNALEEYKLDNGDYPDSSGGTNSLYIALYDNGEKNPDTDRIYLAELDPVNDRQGWIDDSGASIQIVDPWGEEYIYRIASPTEPNATKNPDFDLKSMGKDGETADDLSDPKTKDDISNF